MKSTRPTRQPEREPNQIEPGSSRQGEAQTVIPVLQEELEVHTRRVETNARVRVHKRIEEREELIDEPLAREEVQNSR